MKNILPFYILFAGGWALINGLLHDIFVIKARPVFDKELIRLLIDGHILIFGGIFFIFAYQGIKNVQTWGYYLGIIAAIFILGYCGLILKMLPSVMTILINLIALILLIINLPKNNLI
jgi:hypothetical protein